MVVLHTLGELRIAGDQATALSSPRIALALLAYLAVRSPRPVSRNDLADLFWRERDHGKARQSVRQILLELKRIVGEGLVAEPERVLLAPGVVDFDVTRFQRHLGAAEWREAVDCWKGEFLPTVDHLGGEDFRLWLDAERESLQQGLKKALRALVQKARADGDWPQGVAWGQRWTELIDGDEEGHRHLIELTHLNGQTAEALALHASFAVRLRSADLRPSADYLALGELLERSLAGPVGRRTPGSAALFTPDLTGRGHLLAELEALWRGVRAGQPAVVLVEGEAGIGKSRLCEELLRRLESERVRPTILKIRAYETTPHTALDPLAELAAELAVAPGASGASAAALAELARLAPALRERFPTLPTPSNGRGLEDGLLDVLGAVASERPVVLYFDDFPLADPETQQVLIAVTARVQAPLLFLVTARSGEERSPAYVELSSRAGIRRLKLQPLSRGDIDLMLASMLELSPPTRHHLAERLHVEGGGNPFYTIELTAALVDEGQLLPTDSGAWQLGAIDVAKPIPLPVTIRQVVRRRLERLNSDVRNVLEAAAVLGRAFDSTMLPMVSGLSPAACEVGLEELLARRMVRSRPDPGAFYEFTHEMIYRVTYDLLSGPRRQDLHGRAARSWELKRDEGATALTSLAYHRARAGRPAPRSKLLRAALTGGVGVGLAASAAVFVTPAEQRASFLTLLTRGTPTLSARRVVVAPLTNHTGDSALTGMGAMAADWIAQGLMRTTQFEVVDPRTASVASRVVEHIPALFRDGDRAIAVAEETGSGTVLSGDLFREGDTLRVLIQIIDAASGRIIRTVGPISGPATAPSRLVARLGERVVAAVASAVDTTSIGFSAALGAPPSYEAYMEVSRAWESFFRDDLDDVFRRLERASRLDTTYMAPLLMRAYIETRISGWAAADSLLRRLAAHESLLTPAERAVLDGLQADLRGDLWGRLRAARELIDLTPTSVEGYTLAASTALMVNRPRQSLLILSKIDPDRGLLLVAPYYWVTHTAALHRLQNHKAELESARQGIRRFPGRYWPQTNLLLTLAAIGDVKALKAHAFQATPDDPYRGAGARHASYWVWRELRAHGHEKAATAWLATLLNETPAAGSDTTLSGLILEGDVLYAAQQWKAARAAYETALKRSPRSPVLLGRLGATAARLGEREVAERLVSLLLGMTEPYLFGAQAYAAARIASALGEQGRAVELLRVAWKEGRSIGFDDRENEDVHSDPEFETLRSFPPFLELMRTD